MKKKITVEEFLKERLMTNANGTVFNPFDEIVSFCKMLIKKKLKEQRNNCVLDIEFYFDTDDQITGVNIDSILNAKEPEL